MASRFWVGGTGTWDAADTTHWAATSGGAGGQSVPGTGDAVTIDANSGAGTITPSVTISVQSITCGAMGMTLAFNTNNVDVNLTASTGFSGSGTGTRTISFGSGTWTFASPAVLTMTTLTNATVTASSATFVFSGTNTASRVVTGGGQSYGTWSFGANTGMGGFQLGGANTIGTLEVTGPNALAFPTGLTNSITNAFNLVGSSSAPIFLGSTAVAAATIAAGAASTVEWGIVRSLTFTGTVTATDSIDAGLNTGITGLSATFPSVEGGVTLARVIGG
jgi:hypothetical protein